MRAARFGLNLVLSTALALAPFTVHAAPEDTAHDTSRAQRVVVEVDTSPLGSGGPVVLSQVDERLPALLDAAQFAAGEVAAGDPVLRVEVRDVGDEAPGFLVLTHVRAEGRLVPNSRSELLCELCTESELVQRIVEAIEAALQRVPEPTEASLSTSTSDEGSEAPPLGDAAPADARPGRKLVAGGAGLLGVGAAALVAGGVVATRPPRSDPDDPLYEYSPAIPGWTTLGIGAAALVTGAVLVGLGVSKNKRRLSAGAGATARGAFVSFGGAF